MAIYVYMIKPSDFFKPLEEKTMVITWSYSRTILGLNPETNPSPEVNILWEWHHVYGMTVKCPYYGLVNLF